MSIPDDVLDHIFGFLQSDLAALKACSQSYPRFIHLVERHLYASITLYDNDAISKNGLGTLQFIRFLSKSPYIANYIRTVEIKVTFNSIEYLEGMASVLQMCSLLKEITLCLKHNHWDSLPESFHLAFLDCLHLSSMKTICISHVSDFPLTALSGSKSVKSLTVIRSTIRPDSIQESSSHPPLENLSVQHCSLDSLSSIFDWVQARNLQSLEITTHSGPDSEIVRLSRLLHSCSNTLTNLSFEIGFSYQTSFERMGPIPTIPLSLSSLTCLNKLTISISGMLDFTFGRDSTALNSPMPSITKLLRTAPPFQYLTLAITFYLYHKAESYIPDDLVEDLWSPLVSLVSETPSSFVTLRISSCTIDLEVGSISAEDVCSSILSYVDLRRMVEEGVLILEPVILDPTLL